jgi:hypothetical protein
MHQLLFLGSKQNLCAISQIGFFKEPVYPAIKQADPLGIRPFGGGIERQEYFQGGPGPQTA